MAWREKATTELLSLLTLSLYRKKYDKICKCICGYMMEWNRIFKCVII